MLSFVTPWLFGAALAAAAGVVGLHLLSVRTPPALMLPTARFIVDGDARAVARQPRLNDVALLVLRVLALLLAGAAFAGVRWSRTDASLLRLVVADAALQGDRAWRDSVTRALARDDALVDVHFAPGVATDAGAVLVAATRRAARLAAQHASLSAVELTVVLPPTVVTTAGYVAWRDQWPGAVRVLQYRGTGARAGARDSLAARRPADRGPITVDGGGRDDVVAAAFAAASSDGLPALRIVRAPASPVSDARVARGSAMPTAIEVAWPTNGLPPEWEARVPRDTVGALVASGDVLVGPFERAGQPSAALLARIDSGSAAAVPVRVIAWWGDGTIAATEHMRPATGGAAEMPCTRRVAVVVPRGSDLLLSAAARGLRDVVAAPCAAGRVPVLPLLAAPSPAPTPAAPATAFRAATGRQISSDPWWLTPALLGIATLLLLGEWRVRRGEPQA